jgi:hypothetical protein
MSNNVGDKTGAIITCYSFSLGVFNHCDTKIQNVIGIHRSQSSVSVTCSMDRNEKSAPSFLYMYVKEKFTLPLVMYVKEKFTLPSFLYM